MLNLSDKELDRIARQAADEYEPGAFTGPEQWNKLQAGLDRELGKVRFNPFRAIRRMPFYYAPAVIMLAAVAYYFIRHSSSGSPPASVVKAMPRQPTQAPDESVNTKNLPYKPTSTPAQHQGTNKPGNQSTNDFKSLKPASASATPDHQSPVPAGPSGSGGTEEVRHQSDVANGYAGAKPSANNTRGYIGNNEVASHAITGRVNNRRRTNHRAAGMNQKAAGMNGGVAANGKAGAGKDHESNGNEAREPAYSAIRQQASQAGKPVIDDSGLRSMAVAKRASRPGPITPGKPSPSMRINRSLQIGLIVAPDFSSVNSLAGDHPGSSIGLTADYQFVNKLYLSTGILFSRKNYTATSQDYHVPYNYYVRNNIHNVDFVKGTFNMLEIPLNLRYDFTVAGNTAFFASGGLSSYVLTGENCNYYFDLFGREAYRGFSYKGGGVHLFSAVNLAIGVETGLSNDLSLLISPYVKIPTGGLGFGGVDVNSMGINFGIKYAPVLRRSRH